MRVDESYFLTRNYICDHRSLDHKGLHVNTTPTLVAAEAAMVVSSDAHQMVEEEFNTSEVGHTDVEEEELIPEETEGHVGLSTLSQAELRPQAITTNQARLRLNWFNVNVDMCQHALDYVFLLLILLGLRTSVMAFSFLYVLMQWFL